MKVLTATLFLVFSGSVFAQVFCIPPGQRCAETRTRCVPHNDSINVAGFSKLRTDPINLKRIDIGDTNCTKVTVPRNSITIEKLPHTIRHGSASCPEITKIPFTGCTLNFRASRQQTYCVRCEDTGG